MGQKSEIVFNLTHDEEDDVGDQLLLVFGAEVGAIGLSLAAAGLRLRRRVARSRRARLILMAATTWLRTHDAGFAAFSKTFELRAEE